MNRQQLRELKRLDEKISKAKTNNDIMRLSRLMAEREKLLSADKKELKMTLKDAIEVKEYNNAIYIICNGVAVKKINDSMSAQDIAKEVAEMRRSSLEYKGLL